MNRSLSIVIATLCATTALAQTLPTGSQASVMVLDSSLLHRSIFDLLHAAGPRGNRVVLVQDEALYGAMQQQIIQNESNRIQGYRIRIFSSNAQTARAASLAAKEEFEALFPSIPAYLNYVNLDFRVTVGDFRTRSEAMRFFKELTARPRYSRTAMIVRETISYPPL